MKAQVTLASFKKDDGQDLVEYALVVALVAFAATAGMKTLATGINGAPKIGDHAAWGPRIAQGKETLYKDAISGKGNMPPKGGTNWPDATIRMTVDYMVSLNK